MSRILFLLFLTLPVFSDPDPLYEWKSWKGGAKNLQMQKWIGCLLQSHFDGRLCEKPENSPRFYGKLGVFITLVKKGEIRGCFGAFHHRSDDLEKVLSDYISGAVKEDPRYNPVRKEELEGMKIVLTVADRPIPAGNPENIDIGRYGIFLSKSGAGFVYSPGEIRTAKALKRILEQNKGSEVFYFNAVIFRTALESL